MPDHPPAWPWMADLDRDNLEHLHADLRAVAEESDLDKAMAELNVLAEEWAATIGLPVEDADAEHDEVEPLAAEPDSDLSTGAAFLVNAIQNARVSDIQAAFRHLGWALSFDVVVDTEEEPTP